MIFCAVTPQESPIVSSEIKIELSQTFKGDFNEDHTERLLLLMLIHLFG